MVYVYVPVDPNSADAETLMQLTGVDEAIAEALIEARPYASADAFLERLAASVELSDADIEQAGTIAHGVRRMIEPRLRAILLGIATAGFAGMIAEREIHAGASTGAVLWGALRGVAPAMAPGGLAMAALVAVAATWRPQARRGEPVAGQSS